MTTLQNQILKTFSENKYSFVIDNISYDTLFKKTYAIYILLDLLDLKDEHTVVLSGETDEHWMAVYYACLLKGTNLFILPNQFNFKHFPFYMNRLNVKFAFLSTSKIAEAKKHDTFRKVPFVKGLFDLGRYQASLARISVANTIFSSAQVFDNMQDINTDLGIQAIYDTLNKTRTAGSVYTVTSGVENNYSKVVEHTHDSIMQAVANVSEVLDFEENSFLSVPIELIDRFHAITILNSFLSRSKICTSTYMYVSHNIFDTPTFLKWWKSNIESRISSNVFYRFIKKINIPFIRNWMYLRVLNQEIPQSNKIVILNGSIRYNILVCLMKRKNVIITFGDEENNHAIAYNNFSNKTLKKEKCIGYAFPSVSIHSTSDETKIMSDHLFKQYMIQKVEVTSKLRDDLFLTNDQIWVKKDQNNLPVLFFEGRRSHRLEDVQYDLFERELIGSRFIKTAIFARHPTDNSVVLLVEPDIEEADLYRIGYMGLEKIYDDFLASLNNESRINDFREIAAKSIILTDDTINLKTFDGKNKNLLLNIV